MEIWAHKTSLTPPRFIEVPVIRQESERSCTCVLGVLVMPLFLRFLYLILEMFRQCVLFHFYCWWFKIYRMIGLFVSLMVFNATFNNISDISWRSVVLEEETGGPGETH